MAPECHPFAHVGVDGVSEVDAVLRCTKGNETEQGETQEGEEEEVAEFDV